MNTDNNNHELAESNTETHTTEGAPATAGNRADGPQNNGAGAEAGTLAWVADELDLWHDPDGAAYATVTGDGRPLHVPVRSAAFGKWLAAKHYARFKRPLKHADDLVTSLEANAVHAGPEHANVAARAAIVDGCLYIADVGPARVCLKVRPLCDGESGTPWEEVSDPPVKFIHRDQQRPLPMPEEGGSLDDLRRFVNASESGFLLIVGWILGAFAADVPCPILALSGPQGSGKTGLTRLVRELTDPRDPAMSSLPTTPLDLAIRCRASHVVAFDNGSDIRPALSDALCQAISGTGSVESRALYTNDGLSVIKVGCSRVIFNGISFLANRPDLADRCLNVPLRKLTDQERKGELELAAALDEVKGRIFGVILQGVATALADRHGAQVSRPPRFADWAKWVMAAERGLGLPSGAIVSAFWDTREDTVQAMLEGSVIASTLMRIGAERTEWMGTLTELQALIARSVAANLLGTLPRTESNRTAMDGLTA